MLMPKELITENISNQRHLQFLFVFTHAERAWGNLRKIYRVKQTTHQWSLGQERGHATCSRDCGLLVAPSQTQGCLPQGAVCESYTPVIDTQCPSV